MRLPSKIIQIWEEGQKFSRKNTAENYVHNCHFVQEAPPPPSSPPTSLF